MPRDVRSNSSDAESWTVLSPQPKAIGKGNTATTSAGGRETETANAMASGNRNNFEANLAKSLSRLGSASGGTGLARFHDCTVSDGSGKGGVPASRLLLAACSREVEGRVLKGSASSVHLPELSSRQEVEELVAWSERGELSASSANDVAALSAASAAGRRLRIDALARAAQDRLSKLEKEGGSGTSDGGETSSLPSTGSIQMLSGSEIDSVPRPELDKENRKGKSSSSGGGSPNRRSSGGTSAGLAALGDMFPFLKPLVSKGSSSSSAAADVDADRARKEADKEKARRERERRERQTREREERERERRAAAEQQDSSAQQQQDSSAATRTSGVQESHSLVWRILTSYHFLQLVALFFGCLPWTGAWYFNLERGGLFMDDVMIKRNLNVVDPIFDWDRMIRTDYWGLEMFDPQVWTHKSFRPITVYSFRFDYQTFSFDSHAFHRHNIILHAIAGYLTGSVHFWCCVL